MPCTVGGCERRAKMRGMCGMHYQRVLRTGDPGPAHSLRGMSIDEMYDRYATVGNSTICWEWRGTLNDDGYGVFGYAPQRRAHRYAFERENGLIAPDVMVLHRCDNRKCGNPAHLYLGDNDDNQRDKRERARVRGARHAQARFTDDQIVEILASRAAGHKISAIAARYKVHRDTISRVVNRRSGYTAPIGTRLR